MVCLDGCGYSGSREASKREGRRTPSLFGNLPFDYLSTARSYILRLQTKTSSTKKRTRKKIEKETSVGELQK